MIVVLLLLLCSLCTVEFFPQDTVLQYVFNNKSNIEVILGVNTLREQQTMILSNEKLIDVTGTTHILDLQLELRPISNITIFLEELSPFAPFNIIQIDDLLCGSTTLNNPCINRKFMCCVDLCRGTNYYKCRVPVGVEYNSYRMKEIGVRLGFEIHISDSSKSQELVLLSSDSKAHISLGHLAIQLSLEANDFIYEILSDFFEDTIIQPSGLTSLDDLRILFYNDKEQYMMDEDTWINETSCDITDDDEFKLERDTIRLLELLDGTYSGSLTDNMVRLIRNTNIILYITITTM